MPKRKFTDKERRRADRFGYEDKSGLEIQGEGTGIKVFVSLDPKTNNIILTRRAESSGVIGDSSMEVAPGETALGMTYSEFLDNLGELEISR